MLLSYQYPITIAIERVQPGSSRNNYGKPLRESHLALLELLENGLGLQVEAI
jgi:hypothetical protein